MKQTVTLENEAKKKKSHTVAEKKTQLIKITQNHKLLINKRTETIKQTSDKRNTKHRGFLKLKKSEENPVTVITVR